MRELGGTKRGPGGIVWMLLALLFPLIALAQSSGAQKIGYVDMKRLLDNAPQVVAARAQIAAEFRDRDAQLKVEQARLDELVVRERRDAATMTKPAAEALQREILTLQRGLERTRKQLNDDLKARGDAELSRRWPEITDAVIEYARANGYDLVVPAPMLYASARIDITDEVLARLRTQAAASDAPR